MSDLYRELTKKLDSVYEVFRKNGNTYECLITPVNSGATCNSFEVACRSTRQPQLITFVVSPAEEGHWIPDKKKLVDPWLADCLGSIIINNF